MPTARELLEQADALMRRNRAPIEDADVPELTDVVPESAFESPAAPVVLEDVPELAPPAGESEPALMPDAVVPEGEPSVWLDEGALLDEVTLGEVSVTGPAPDSILAVATVTAAPETDLISPPVERADAVAAAEVAPAITVEPMAEPAGGPSSVAPNATSPSRDEDPARWEALAEEIRMQVLQRIDIFTDTGLKEQLNERLQPMVDRASAELVGTISVHVGQLLRAYVAEAIEREIEKWRAGRG
jgi:hypothetical protein